MKAIPGAYTMVALGEANKTHNEFQFDTKAVIVPLVSSTGHGHASMKRVKYQEGKFALGSILCAIIPKDEKLILAKYLHIYLHWNREELLVSQMKGMANVSLPMNKIADVIVIVPNIEKQKEIIDLEKKLVERELKADTLFEDQLNQLENLNQAILQEAVQGKLVEQDPKDEPANELLKRIKAEKAKSGKKEKPILPIKLEEIPFEIPENWVWCKIGEVANLFTGNSINESTKSTKYTKVKEGLQYIGTKDVEFGGLGINYNSGIKIPFDEPGFRKASKNSILICIEGGSSGKKYAITDREICFGNKLLSTEINKSLIAHCFYYFYQSPHFKSEFKLKSKGLRGGVSINQFKEILIPIPPKDEQNRIVTEIEKQLDKTKQLKENIIANQQATEQLLKALLHQAFEVEEMEEV
jgi:type I restriction enzyme S subunit